MGSSRWHRERDLIRVSRVISGTNPLYLSHQGVATLVSVIFLMKLTRRQPEVSLCVIPDTQTVPISVA